MANAKLLGKEVGVTVDAMFNPKELSVEKSVSWTPKEGADTDEPPAEFSKPTPANLSVTLYFDTYESGAASCGPGLHCEETQAKTFCEGDRLPGAACTRSRQCKASLICAAGSCREAPGKVDEACDFLDPRACERDLYCNQKCEPRLGKGKHCTTDASCKSGDCDIGGKDVCQ